MYIVLETYELYFREKQEYNVVCVCPSGDIVSLESPCGLSVQGSESSADVEVESSAAEADQDMTDEAG